MPDCLKNKFEIVNPIQIPSWNDRILQSSNHSIFLTSYWVQVLTDSYGFCPKYFVAVKNSTFEFLLPFMEINNLLMGKKGISLPFSDFCEPINQNDFFSTDVGEEILKSAKSFGWKSLEFRGANKVLKRQKSSTSYYMHVLNLTDEQNLFSALKSNVKRNIKKAKKEAVQILIEDSKESLQNYYQLHCLTRKRHGLPPQPFRFFAKIYDYIVSNGYGKIVTAYINKQAIAAAIYLYFGDQVIYKFGASDLKYQHYRPNNLVMWEAILYFTRQGFKTLHLGKTEIQNEGLRKFKLSWGAGEETINYYKFDVQKNCFLSENSKEQGWYNSLFSKIPVPILKLMGSLIYKHAA